MTMPTSELPSNANTRCVHFHPYTFVLTRSVRVSIEADTQQDAQDMFCLVFGDLLFSQVKSIY